MRLINVDPGRERTEQRVLALDHDAFGQHLAGELLVRSGERGVQRGPLVPQDWNAGALQMVGDSVYSNQLSSGPYAPLGSGLYNDTGPGNGIGITEGGNGGIVTQYFTSISFNFNADGSYGGDTYGV
jgi:hypothetical protein